MSSCDALFKKAPRINEYRTWVLRIGKKGNRPPPKYLYTIKSKFEGTNLQSRAHATYLSARYGLPINLTKPIGGEELETQEYNTRMRTTVKEMMLEEEVDE